MGAAALLLKAGVCGDSPTRTVAYRVPARALRATDVSESSQAALAAATAMEAGREQRSASYSMFGLRF